MYRPLPEAVHTRLLRHQREQQVDFCAMQRAMQREALAPDILDDDHIHRRMLFWPANRNTVAFAEHTAGVKIAPQLYRR